LLRTPPITRALERPLAELDKLRAQLGDATGVAMPWLGNLRRQARAATVGSSVAIEGFTVGAGETLALVSGDQQPDPGNDDELAVAAYAHAMDHVGTLAIDPVFRWSDRVVLDLHFDTCSFQRDRGPGLWRTGPIAVTGFGGSAEPAFRGPDAEAVPGLMGEVSAWLQDGDLDAHVAVRAAMAHLHVVSVHPFADGNGRISRIVQSLVLAREGLLAPEFSSIEEYLGAHMSDYYRVLQQVQGGTYRPERDAAAWVRFCIDAHVAQARQRLQQVHDASARWSRLEQLVDERGWPDRLVIALEQALFAGVDRASYMGEAGVSPATATSDLRRLADAQLLTSHGRARTTRYHATAALRRLAAGSG
jgi:Fic family protein